MTPEQALRWKGRFAFMYALGSWTLVGAIVYYYRLQPREAAPAGEGQGPLEASAAAPAAAGSASWEAEFDEERTPPNETPADEFFRSPITYRENAVPPTPRCVIM